MEIVWDPRKNRSNLRKHGISFEDAKHVFDDPDRIEVLDDREYDEERWAVIGRVEQIVLYVIYTERGGTIRLISARKADRNARADYDTGKGWA